MIDPTAVIGKQPLRGGVQPPPVLGDGVVIGAYAVIYAGCTIGDGTVVADLATVRERVKIGSGCTVGRGVCVENDCTIGDRVRLQTNAYITAHSTLKDDVFVGPCVVTTNDNYVGRDPERFAHRRGVTVRRGGRVGAGAVILPGVTIGEDALVGAGAVVTKDVPAHQIWYGGPARFVRDVPSRQRLENQ